MAPQELLDLAHAFGDPANDLCILAEGNVSCRASDDTFWIKASGVQMGSMSLEDFVEVRLEPLWKAIDGGDMSEVECRTLLNDARVDQAARHIPSTEAFMHAYLLNEEGVRVVGHSHPTPLLSLLSLKNAGSLAGDRFFPDEVVLCGPWSPFVPYVAPGLPLAKALREPVFQHCDVFDEPPKSIWLQNHGLICPGSTAAEVLNASLMSVKAAHVKLGALQSGQKLRPLTRKEVSQIHSWPDEHYRQQMLRGGSV